MSSHSYINPESVFAQTALEMVATHGPDSGAPDDHMCDRCQSPLPCPPVRNAILVLEGAGLPVHPAGSAEARRAAAQSALGHPASRLGGSLLGTGSRDVTPPAPDAGDAALPDRLSEPAGEPADAAPARAIA
ncbi:hypothetical protein [Catenuloplanes atrovinosus]|uniref:Uncharacterized protein n=1 Tax=Catenuloplanes atrovinosus TaxID=137266 RepID=A0AAE4CAD1_9ACTN|nr:hypothetical protein [Catenuloplanes atrovinosus]MDR7274500.1 hypothetical protein [Catenuloplanes atrovinosus]